MDLQEAFDKGFEAVKAYLDTELTAIRREFADLVAKSIPAPVVMKDVRDGIDGRDGVGLAGAVIDRDGALVLTLSNGEQKSLGQIIGKDGADGLNGADVDMEAVLAHVETVARNYLEAIPAPKDGRDGVDGKSVDPAEVAELVSRAVAEIPLPKDGIDGKDGRDGADGRDGTDVDPELIERMVSERVVRAVEALPKAVDGIDGLDGRDGIDGKSIDPDEVAQMVSKAVSEIPAPKDGKDGIDGKDGVSITLEEIEPLVAKAISAIPLPKDGRDGVDGRDGLNGENGLDGKSVTIEDIAPVIAEHVSKAVSEIPAPRDGIDGKSVTVEDIAPLVSEQVSKAVSELPKAKDGRDGIGIAEALKDADGQLVLTMTDGTVKKVGSMIGLPGKDGFSLKDFDIEQIDDGRTLLFSFDDGHIKQSVEIDFPISIYRGIYQDGTKAKRGDCYTWAGSVWHCEEPTTEKPGEGSKSWRLAVKRGRDGKDFAGPQNPPSGKVKL